MNEKSEGKIFESGKFLADDLAQQPSLGHRLLDKLKNDTSDSVIYIDVASGRQWRGAELREKILNIASALVDQYQFKKGTAVCISYENSDTLIILSLAVICAGGIISNPYYKDPYNEVLYLAGKVYPKFLFCHQRKLKWAEQLTMDLGYQVIGISIDGDASSFKPYKHVKHLFDYDHKRSSSIIPVPCKDASMEVAMISMSSGTTGRPKAVPMTHKNCLVDLKSVSCTQPYKTFCPCVSSFDYVSGRVLLLVAIENGCTALILNGFEPQQYLETVQKYRANMIFLGAAAFYDLITFKDLDEYDISSVKIIFPMGVKITYIDELRKFTKKVPNLENILQGYGASEISSVAVSRRAPDEYLNDPDNCGKLIAGMLAKVVDPETGKLLDCNQQGELRIKGRTTFPGYYDAKHAKSTENNNSNENTDTNGHFPFIYDSAVFDEDGFYLTGDIVYFTEKGELYVVGRHKERMSCRNAKKVLPQELESILSEHPAVSKVCVVGIPNQKQLIIQCPRAFIVVKANCCTDKEIEISKRLDQVENGNVVENEVLEHEGNHKLCTLETERRRLISEDIMKFAEERIAIDKRLYGGIAILDQLDLLRTGKIDKGRLRSLTKDEIEIYGDRSG